MAPKIRKKASMALATSLIILASLALYLPLNTLTGFVLNKPALHGFQSEFVPEDVPMVNQHNVTVNWQDFAQQPLFLTTGFTACNFSCPITMAFYTQLKSQLSEPANFAMLSIDPEYDTPERLKAFLAHFDNSFIGLRIDQPVQMQQLIASLRLNIGYAGGDISHTDYIYLLHPNLDGVVIYTQPDADLIAQDLQTLTTINR